MGLPNTEQMRLLIADHGVFALNHTSCKRKDVACAVFNEQGDANWFYNGPFDDDGELCSNEVGNCGCTHAEFRAVKYCIGQNEYGERFKLLCNYSPCTSCANLIVVSECIDCVYYVTLTEHDKRGVRHLQNAGIEVVQLKRPEFNGPYGQGYATG